MTLFVGGLGLLSCIVALRFLAASGFQPTTDERAIRNVISQALVAKQTLVVPPASYGGGKMPDAMQAQMLGRVTETLGRYYTGEPLARYSAAIQNSIRDMSDGNGRAFGGGLSALEIREIVIHDGTAVVTARAFTWSEVGQLRPDGKMVKARPEGGEDYTFNLVRRNSQWLISGEWWTFVEGTGP